MHYRIQIVSQMTGVPSATLRAWERRYGFPQPNRSDSSYRLYSEQDVSDIKNLKQLCEKGVSPSEAVRLLKQQSKVSPKSHTPIPNSPSPIPSIPNAKLKSTQASTSPFQINSSDAQNLPKIEHARDILFTAIKRFDPILLETSIRKSLLLGSAKSVFDQIFAPVLREVGQQWHDGKLSIAQEHLATEAIGNATRDLLRMVQPDYPCKQILLACFQDELHALPLYGSALHFIQWGYRAVILGVNTPPQALKESVLSLKPDAVGLSITQGISSQKAKRIIPEYHQACCGLPWLVGGSGAQSVKKHVEGFGGIVSMGNPDFIRTQFESLISNTDRSFMS